MEPLSPQRTSERYRTLLEINNAIISNLTQESLFRAVALALGRVVPFDRSAIFLYDDARQVLRLSTLESSVPSEHFRVGLEIAPGESHVGRVFQTREPLVRHSLEQERAYPPEDQLLAEGFRSLAVVPMLARGKCIGTLNVASLTTGEYDAEAAEFLQEIANQVALAIENMKSYEETAALSREMQQEVERRRYAEETLHAITEGTAAVTGSDFFYSLVRHLAQAFRVRYAFVTDCRAKQTAIAHTLAFWSGDGYGVNSDYDITHTPCVHVLGGKVLYYAKDLPKFYPEEDYLLGLGVESYLGIPIVDAGNDVIGHIAVMDTKPMPETPPSLPILKVFAARAAAELERLRAERELREALAEVEALRNRLQAENVYLQEEIRREHNFVEMVGSHPALLAVQRKIEQVAPTDSTVLIYGETGTGKELIARAIHNRSRRRDRTLVKVNCSAISAGLVESELFGHVKGAFTGALERRQGRFELADGGTIFLDEVGELLPETQVKLLRVLQEGEFEPVGSSRTQQVDVRVIAATNRNLDEAVKAGRFRADLFYRLNVFPIEMPPLRERSPDIPALVMFFVGRYARRFGKRVEAVAPETMNRLMSYDWPGNVRELQNIVERAVVLTQGPVLELDRNLLPVVAVAPALVAGRENPLCQDLVRPAVSDTGDPARLPTLQEMERDHILAALKRTGGVIHGPRGAANLLKLHPNTLRSRMQRLGITRASYGMS